MRPNWKEVPKGDVQTAWAGFYVTMNPKGKIVFTRTTWQKMGEPKAFQVFFDTVNNRIGLKPAALTTRNAFPVWLNSNRGGRAISCGRLIKEYRILLPMTVRFYDADTDEDGILILDLRTAKVSPKAEGHATRKKANNEQ